MSNLDDMLKQAQKMQKDVDRAQNDLSSMEVSYSNNGVEVTAKGDNTIASLNISAELLENGDKEMLEDLVLIAVNGALDKIRVQTESKMSGIAGGLNIPGLF